MPVRCTWKPMLIGSERLRRANSRKARQQLRGGAQARRGGEALHGRAAA